MPTIILNDVRLQICPVRVERIVIRSIESMIGVFLVLVLLLLLHSLFSLNNHNERVFNECSTITKAKI